VLNGDGLATRMPGEYRSCRVCSQPT